MNIKAIETVYNGYRFRSRLEARWAVFFDALGVKYEYEKEGFNLSGVEIGYEDSGREKLPDNVLYLPDFWLSNVSLRSSTEQGLWFEVKGTEMTDCNGCRTASPRGRVPPGRARGKY